MEDPKGLVRGQKILFLTTVDMSPSYLKGQNTDVLPEFARLGAHVTFRNCIGASEPLDTKTLSQFNAIILWTCDKYNFHFEEFSRFLREVLTPFQKEHPEVHVINGADIALWNAEKSYLSELETAGFRISKTLFVDRSTHSPPSLKELLCSLDSKPAVLKPSVSASGRMTRCVKEPKSLSSDDEAFLEDILAEKSYIGSIMIQEYEEAISKGEYSLAFTGRELTLAMVKKPATGQFKVNQRHGGQIPSSSSPTFQRAQRRLGIDSGTIWTRNSVLRERNVVWCIYGSMEWSEMMENSSWERPSSSSQKCLRADMGQPGSKPSVQPVLFLQNRQIAAS